MRSGMSFINRGIFYNDFKVFGWLGLIYLLALSMDITGYENKVPQLAEVEKVYFGDVYFVTNTSQDKTIEKMNTYYDRENIRSIENFHRQLIADKAKLKYGSPTARRYPGFVRTMMFAYKLRNGDEIIRGYQVPVDQYNGYLKPVYESMEYKKKHYEILTVNPDRVDKITIVPGPEFNRTKKAVITEPGKIKEAVRILQEETKGMTAAEMNDTHVAWANVNIMLDNGKTVSLEWRRSYKEFDKWLKDQDLWKDARILPEDIKYIEVEKLNRNGGQEIDPNTGQPVRGKTMKITDKKLIEECLNQLKTTSNIPQYLFTVTMEDQQSGWSVDANGIPGFVREYFGR